MRFDSSGLIYHLDDIDSKSMSEFDFYWKSMSEFNFIFKKISKIVEFDQKWSNLIEKVKNDDQKLTIFDII